MESNIIALMRKLESIKAHADNLYKSFEQADNTLVQTKLKMNPNASFAVEFEIEKQKYSKGVQTRMILKEYNDSSSNVLEITKISIPQLSVPSTEDEVRGVLHQICIECDRVVGFLNASFSPVSPQDADRLNKLRAELTDVTVELDVEYEKNLNEAINEQEKGHCLASALITSRVVNHVFDQIEGNDIEAKVSFLQDQNIVQKGKEGEDDKAFVLKASKKARNVFSHEIKVFPNPSDSISLLGDCVKLLRILAQLKKQTA
jgi:hypothetical protein